MKVKSLVHIIYDLNEKTSPLIRRLVFMWTIKKKQKTKTKKQQQQKKRTKNKTKQVKIILFHFFSRYCTVFV